MNNILASVLGRYSFVAMISFCFVMSFATEATAVDIPVNGRLRIESGMHTTQVMRVSLSLDGAALLTTDFHTGRLWESATGRLLQIYRPPIEENTSGKLLAGALSPDGTLVALGGLTDEDDSIFLFERASGRLLRRLVGTEDIVYQLTFSPDGQLLVAGTKENGLFVFKVDNGWIVASDRDYEDRLYGATFSRNGHLATSSPDGFIRLYDERFKRLEKVVVEGDKEPYGLAFSPDGERLAVGYQNASVVDVLSSRTLKKLYSPDVLGLMNTLLSSVAWSNDGQTLYAAGSIRLGDNPILAWSQQGRGARRALPGTQDTIFDLQRWGAGGVAYAATDPSWGLLDAHGQRVAKVDAKIPDFRNGHSSFRLSHDGTKISFAYQAWGKDPIYLDLSLRELHPASVLDPPLQAAISTSSSLRVEGWKYTSNPTPTINKRPLALEQDERSRSVSVHPAGEGVLLGTDTHLRYYDKQAQERWSIPGAGVAWSVNIAGNGKLAAVASSDGAIHWYRLSDGKELLAFFLHADKLRWIIWTPEGFFDAAPGGDELLGWNIDHGADQATEFLPISAARAQLFRPDVISRVLETLDVNEAVKLANKAAKQQSPVVLSK